MTIFGGVGSLNDVWVLSNANGVESTTPAWTQIFPTGPLPNARASHTAIYDTVNNRMTIFGGSGGSVGDLNDVWVLSNANGLDSTTSAWTQLFPTGSAPTSRDGHTAVYDITNNRMTIFGGENSDVQILLNDTWVLSNANGLGGTPFWTQLTPSGTLPPPRSILCYYLR
jgi:N-acetylneuraminic acid mutarotase